MVERLCSVMLHWWCFVFLEICSMCACASGASKTFSSLHAPIECGHKAIKRLKMIKQLVQVITLIAESIF